MRIYPWLKLIVWAAIGILVWQLAGPAKGKAISFPDAATVRLNLPETWRRPENAAANCLFIQLKLANVPCDYQGLLGNIGGMDATFEAMKQTAGRLGLQTTVMRLTYSQLRQTNGAPIVLIETNGVGSGTLVLFVAGDDQWVEYVDGPTLRWRRVPADSFCRWWSGHALVATPAIALAPVAAKVTLVPLAVLVVSLFVIRARKSSRCARNLLGSSRVMATIAIVIGQVIFALAAPQALGQAPTQPVTRPTIELAPQPSASGALGMIPVDVQQLLIHQTAILGHITISWDQSKTGPIPDRMLQQGIAGPERVRLAVDGDSASETTTPMENPSRRPVQRRVLHGDSFFVTANNPPTKEILKSGLIVKQHLASYLQEQPYGRPIVGLFLEAAGFRVRGNTTELGMRVRSNVLRLASRGRIVSFHANAGTGTGLLEVTIEAPNERTESANQIAEATMRKQLVGAGVSPAQIETELVNLRREKGLPANSIYKLLLDPSHGYAVVDVEERSPQGKLLSKTSNSAFVRVATSQLWLPGKSVVTEFDPDPSTSKQIPVVTTEFKLRDAVTSVDPASFQVDMNEPGMYVTEISASGGRSSYEVPASPVDLDAALDKARSEGRLPSPTRHFDIWDVIIWGGVGVTVVSLVGILILWRRRILGS